MPSLTDQLLGFAANRLVHVPEKDVQSVVDAMNQMRDPDDAPITVADWRLFEKVEVLYASHRLIQQVIPGA